MEGSTVAINPKKRTFDTDIGQIASDRAVTDVLAKTNISALIVCHLINQKEDLKGLPGRQCRRSEAVVYSTPVQI